MRGTLASVAYGLCTGLVRAYSSLPLSPLLWASDQAIRAGDALSPADDTRGEPTTVTDQPGPAG